MSVCSVLFAIPFGPRRLLAAHVPFSSAVFPAHHEQLLVCAESPMSNKLLALEQTFVRKDLPAFRAGDTIRVHFKINEDEKERVQTFEGICIARRHGKTNRATFTVRKMSFSVGVERIFPVSSPRIEKVEVIQRGRVRRAKLFFLRALRGKKARIRPILDYKA